MEVGEGERPQILSKAHRLPTRRRWRPGRATILDYLDGTSSRVPGLVLRLEVDDDILGLVEQYILASGDEDFQGGQWVGPLGCDYSPSRGEISNPHGSLTYRWLRMNWGYGPRFAGVRDSF